MFRFISLLFLSGAAAVSAQDLMPVPAAVTPGGGELAIDANFRLKFEGYREPRLTAAGRRLTARLSRSTGVPLVAGSGTPTLVIQCQGSGEAVQTEREIESYTLEVTPKQARITAATPVGALHGMETFLQLVAPSKNGFAASVVRIDDKPRFPWRGLMIDSARHFQPLDVIERNLDAMAAVKLNVFHWHLSDNQGFRVESKVFPKLQEMGSDGQFYTQAQIRSVIAYARERGIRVIPEFDMPGHSTAWFVGYPQLASGPGPYGISREWGVFDPAMDPTREETYEFLDRFIGEMAALFPDPYFHMGGDEVNGKQWQSNSRIQEWARAHGIKGNHELQAYFNKHVSALVTKHGKKLVGWDEILEPGLPKDVVVQSWRGQQSLADAARKGYRGILSFGYYLDLMFPASYHYGIDPFADGASSLGEAERARILGGEACEWSEYADQYVLEARIWPRAAVIAERLWSPQSTTDPDSMYRRMQIESVRLEWLGLKHRTSSRLMLERIAGNEQAGAVEALAAAVEPVKEYAREEARKYTQSTPLNRLVDAAPAESVTARQFSRDVERLLSGEPGRRDALRKQALLWRDQHDELAPAFAHSFLAAEVEPVSADVAGLGKAAVEALDYLAVGNTAPQSWVESQSPLFARAKTLRAELLVVILEPVQKLVKAAAAK